MRAEFENIRLFPRDNWDRIFLDLDQRSFLSRYTFLISIFFIKFLSISFYLNSIYSIIKFVKLKYQLLEEHLRWVSHTWKTQCSHSQNYQGFSVNNGVLNIYLRADF